MRRVFDLWLWACALAVCLTTWTSAYAVDWFVDASAPTSGQTGESWEHAWVTIQQALPPLNDELAPGDRILVAGGTYTPTFYTESINLASEVSIQGRYVGYSGLAAGTENNRTEVSIVSGDVDQNDDPLDPYNSALSSDNARAVVNLPGGIEPPSPASGSPADYANLDGFDITGSRNGSTINEGGGIYGKGFSDTRAVIRNCRIFGNGPVKGGVYTGSAVTITLRNCSIYDNMANGGGGVGVTGETQIINCQIMNNTATDGAGVFSSIGSLTVLNSNIHGNIGTGQGRRRLCLGNRKVHQFHACQQ